MDSIEVTFDQDDQRDGAWTLYVQAFRPDEGGMVRASEYHGLDPSITEGEWMGVRSQVMRALESMVLKHGLMVVRCDHHGIPYCSECRTSVWAPGPFD